MNQAKYAFPIDVFNREALEKLLGRPLPADVKRFEIRVPDDQNPVLDENGRETGKTLADYA